VRIFRIILVFTCIIALLFPLLGLGYLIAFPPPDPWGQPVPHLLDMLQEKKLQERTINSLLLSISVAFGATLFGGILAWMEHRYHYLADRWLHILSLLPLAIPSYLIAASLSRSIDSGALSWFEFQGKFIPAWFSLVVVTAPYVQIACGSALRNSSASEEEAALLLTSSWSRRFIVSTWPNIRSAVVFSMLISFLYAISDFGAVATLNLEVLTWSLFQSIRLADLHSAALMGAMLLILTMPILLIAHTTIRSKKTKKVSNPRPIPKKKPQKGLLILVYCIHIVVIGGGVLLPIYSMISWVWDGWMRELEFASISGALWGTIWISGFGALCTVLLSLAPVWESVRSRYGTKIPLLIYTASALPGVLLAFALMQSTLLITKHTGGYAVLLSSGALLFLGYALRFLAEGFGPLYNSIEQLDPRHEESARLLGATPRKWFTQVSFPIIRPSIIVSFLLVWLAIIKELPVTLILGSAIGGKTLAFHIWDRYEEALWHDAGLGGLALITLALICFGFTLRWRRHV
jgi:iron(III) transport system permease protein